MSRPSNNTRPASGAISPVSWPISVVLPAPFGPMMACNSPAATSSTTSSEASTPPKRLVSPSILSSGSATVRSRQQAVDPAAREQHDQQEDRPDDDLPILDDAGQRLLQHQQRHCAEHRTENRAHAAEHRHHDQV